MSNCRSGSRTIRLPDRQASLIREESGRSDVDRCEFRHQLTAFGCINFSVEARRTTRIGESHLCLFPLADDPVVLLPAIGAVVFAEVFEFSVKIDESLSTRFVQRMLGCLLGYWRNSSKL